MARAKKIDNKDIKVEETKVETPKVEETKVETPNVEVIKMERANRIAVQNTPTGYKADFYRTHKKLATLISEETGWEADSSLNKSALRESFRQFAIEHAAEVFNDKLFDGRLDLASFEKLMTNQDNQIKLFKMLLTLYSDPDRCLFHCYYILLYLL